MGPVEAEETRDVYPAGKAGLRRRLLDQRARLTAHEKDAAGPALRDRVLALAGPRAGRTVAAYVSTASEPDTAPLLTAFVTGGTTVLLPVLLADGDLDWARYGGPQDLQPARFGLLEPVGPRLGVGAVAAAELVVVPALAVDSSGRRLGRGGGSYDRALARVPDGRLVVALLYDHELLSTVPADAHDHAVSAVVTPVRTVAFG
jgi:5-formyltetrahydrofolate cyclo-ligase